MAKERKARLKRVTSLFMSAVMAATLVQVQLAPGAAAEESADSSSSTTVNADSLSIVSNKNAYRKYIARYPDAAKPMEEVNIDVTKFEQSDDINVQLEDYDGEKKCVAWVDCEGHRHGSSTLRPLVCTTSRCSITPSPRPTPLSRSR